MKTAWIFATRELRSGLRGFGIFLACLALGIAAIAAVGSTRTAILKGLERDGAALLGATQNCNSPTASPQKTNVHGCKAKPFKCLRLLILDL